MPPTITEGMDSLIVDFRNDRSIVIPATPFVIPAKAGIQEVFILQIKGKLVWIPNQVGDDIYF
jgi:hypothetical protein